MGELFAMRADGQIGIRDDRNRRGTGGDQRLGGGDLLGELRQRVRVCVTLILQAASQADASRKVTPSRRARNSVRDNSDTPARIGGRVASPT